jgi:predicted deacylase
MRSLRIGLGLRARLVLLLSLVFVGAAPTQLRAQQTPASSAPSSREATGSMNVLGVEVARGTKHRLSSQSFDDFAGMRMAIPVWVAHGKQPGKVLCVTAGIHGDELNGVEVARRVFVEADPEAMSGTLVVMPVLNRHGFLAGTRYMHDRRDLNRAFPGTAKGSAASIIAHSVFKPVICQADALVDLHTASDRRINLPQIRTDLSSPAALELARHFGVGVVLNGEGPDGSLRHSAMAAGVPAIIYEAGGVFVLQSEEIDRGVLGVQNVMRHLGMLPTVVAEKPPLAIVYKKTKWLRVPPGAAGMFLTKIKPGDIVTKGQHLGEVVDPLSDATAPITSTSDGVIIGMVAPTVVYTGDALFHVGLERIEQ